MEWNEMDLEKCVSAATLPWITATSMQLSAHAIDV
jgi:hypothetical protein